MTVAEALGPDSDVIVGAQNAHWEDGGAWTGEVSVPQAKDAGATLVELGHSERRTHFNETDATVNLKVRAVLRHGLIPLVCVGEPDEVFRQGGSSEYVVRQAHAALDQVDDVSDVLIAYEPVWAIGEGGRPAQSGRHRVPVRRAHRGAAGSRTRDPVRRLGQPRQRGGDPGRAGGRRTVRGSLGLGGRGLPPAGRPGRPEPRTGTRRSDPDTDRPRWRRSKILIRVSTQQNSSTRGCAQRD